MLKTVLKSLAFFSILFLMACPSPVDNGDAKAVESAKAALTIGYKAGDNAGSVTADITLPSTGTEDTTITWKTSDANVIGTDGSVTRPETDAADAAITLTATISKGTATDTKVFTLTVKKVEKPPMSGDFDYGIPALITYGDGPTYVISTNNIATTQGVTFALETPVTGITVAENNGTITVAEDLDAGDYTIKVIATSPDFSGEISQSETITVQKKSITGTTLQYTSLTLGVGVDSPDNTSNSPTDNFLVGGDTLADAVDFTIAKKNGPGPDTVGTIDTDGVITVDTANNFTATDYTVTATAKADGNYADSTAGDISITVTADDRGPGKPGSFVVSTENNGDVELAWAEPTDKGMHNNQEASITAYTIYYSTSSTFTKDNAETTIPNLDPLLRSHTITSGLTAGTEYHFLMTATNGHGEGGPTDTKSTYTNGAPGAPTLTSVTGGDEEATLAWTAPTDTGYSGGSATAITGYYIYHSTTSGFNKDTASGVTKSGLLGVGASPHTITGLTTAGTQYYFLVTAANAAAEGAASNEMSTYTDGDPGAPSLTVTATSTGVSVGWTVSDPGYSGGSAASVTGIDIYYADQTGVTTTSGGTHVSVSTTSATGSEAITIDDPGVEYYFIATATTGAGTSVGSTEASVILNKAPGAPTSFTATGGDEEVTLNWAAPSDLGYVNGSEGSITGYAIYYKAGSSVTTSDYDTVTTAILTATSKTITGLSAGTQYHFIMTASNDHAESVPTDERATHTDTVPEKPTGVSLSGGDQRVTLTWTAPGNTGYVGGSAGTLTGYNIYYSQNSGVTVENGTKHEVNSGTATMQEISNLAPNTQYYFIITAKTAAGESLPTNEESFTISPAFSSGEVIMSVNEITTRVGTATSGQVTVTTSLIAGTDYTLSLQRPPGANASVTIDNSGSITVANTVAAADGGQYTVIATGSGGKKLSAAFTLTLYDTDLAGLLLTGGTIPADLSSSDAFTQAILADYNAGATMTAFYVTENGAGSKDGSSWANAIAGTGLRSELSSSAGDADNIHFILVGAGTYKPTSQMTMRSHAAIIGGWPASGGWIRGGAETIFDGEKQRRLFLNNFLTNAKLYGAVIQNGSYSTANGGAVFSMSSTTAFIDVRFLNNTSGSNGGAVYDRDGTVKFSNVTFDGNTSTVATTGSVGGGALYTDTSSAELTDVVFKNNKAHAYGGGHYSLNASLEYSRVQFLNNESGLSKEGDGGGLFVRSGSNIKLSHVIFDGNNTAKGNGGGASIWTATGTSLSHVTFKNNTILSYQNGGGLYAWESDFSVSHATFSGNSGRGSAIGTKKSTYELNQMTITENDGDAVIFYGEDSNAVITNTLIWGNTATIGGVVEVAPAFWLEPKANTTDVLTIYNSLWEEGIREYGGVKGFYLWGGSGSAVTLTQANNIITDGTEADVLGSLMTTGDEYLRTYALNANTQAQDAGIYVRRGTDGTYYYSGDNSAWFSDPGLTTSVTLPGGTEELTAKDVPGNSRNGVPDIGAYELQ